MQTQSRSSRWELTQETFDGLLRSLHVEEEAAVERYRRLHGRLVLFFMRHRSYHPEDLADQVVNRLACKLSEGLSIENIEAFALGMARLVVCEEQARSLREQNCYFELERNKSITQHTLSERESSYHSDRWMETLMENQLATLPVAQRSMLLRYHEGKGIRRIRERQKLAEEMGLSIGTLRKRIFDLQAMLRAKLTQAADASTQSKSSEEKDYL